MPKTGKNRPPSSGEKRTVKMTLYLTPALRKSLRFQALREDRSATALVKRLITKYLDERRERRKAGGQSAKREGGR